MEPKIESLDDLRAERARLKNEVQLAQTHIRSDLGMNSAQPGGVLRTARLVQSFMPNRTRQKTWLDAGLALGVDTLLTRTGVLKRSAWPVRLALPFLIKNLTGNLLHSRQAHNLAVKALTWVKEKTADPPRKAQPRVELIEHRDYHRVEE
jgi:hypothetical protein